MTDLAEGGQQVLEHNGTNILLCRVQGVIHAVSAFCTHQGACLQGGRVRGTTISCPLHGARFDLLTGRVLGGLNYPPLTVYAVADQDGEIQLSAESADPTPPRA